MDQTQTRHLTSPAHTGTGQPNRFAFIQSCWHRDIVDQARDAYLAEMDRRGVPAHLIDLLEVPGAFELPLLAKQLARTGRYKAIVACGFVVDGGIYRHEFVASAVIDALMSIQLDAEVPIISAVLTPQSFHEHADHRQFFAGHFVIKGTEAATACLGIVEALKSVEQLAA